MRGVSTFVLAALMLCVACADTSRFTTKPGESYCGTVTSASFVRAGVAEGVRMRLELDADHLQDAPGRLWTDSLAGGDKLDGAVLRVIPQILHDPLSTLTFGEGRVKNTFAIADLGTTQVTVILSLLQSGDVEVRLIRGASSAVVPDGGPATPPQMFAVFRLVREKSDCGLK